MAKKKPTKRPRVSKLARETGEIVALLRQLREKMAVVEDLEPRQPDATRLSAYARPGESSSCAASALPSNCGCVAAGARRASARWRRNRLQVIALMESEFSSDGDTAH
jgi:hypothetical protein